MDFVECPAPAAAVSAPEDDNEGGNGGGGGGNDGAIGRAGATGIGVCVDVKDLAGAPAIDTVPSGLVNLFAADGVLPPLLVLLLPLLLAVSDTIDSINLADRPGFILKIAGEGKNRSNSSTHGYPGKYFSFSASMSS